MFEMQISGGDKIAKMLNKLADGPKQFKKAAKKETREGLKEMLRAARNNAPKKTGRLRKAIKIKVWTKPDRGVVGHKIIINPGRKRTDLKGAWYGMMIEGGYVSQGKYVPGRHMLTNAYKTYRKKAISRLGRSILGAVNRIIKGS